MKKIIEMNRDELLALEPRDIQRFLTSEEVKHIARTLGAFWSYDYEASKAGKHGLHAELKSGRHSDGFFVSRIMLEADNIRSIMAHQIVMRLADSGVPSPCYIAGIPDGATALGKIVADILGSAFVEMRKCDGRIELTTKLCSGADLLFIEDFCTRATGFREAVAAVATAYPDVEILPYDPVIINRGGLEVVEIDGPGKGRYEILPVVDERVSDWAPAECPLCKSGSEAIKPKVTDADWYKLINSQK